MSQTYQTRLPEQEFSKAVELTLKSFAKNNDGFLTKAEFIVLLSQVKGLDFPITQALADNMFLRADTKRDGKIDIQELFAVLSQFYYN